MEADPVPDLRASINLPTLNEEEHPWLSQPLREDEERVRYYEEDVIPNLVNSGHVGLLFKLIDKR